MRKSRVEANPTSVEAGRFAGFPDGGREQSFARDTGTQRHRPGRSGRRHTAQEAVAALRIAQSTFGRCSFDLIYARPDDTPQAWGGEQELRQAVAEATEHLSLYQLTIEPEHAFRDAS